MFFDLFNNVKRKLIKTIFVQFVSNVTALWRHNIRRFASSIRDSIQTGRTCDVQEWGGVLGTDILFIQMFLTSILKVQKV